MLFGVTWPLLTFELLSYAVFALCFVHALRQGPRRRERLALLLTGTAYGVTLESLTIFQLHAYYYGHFLVMFAGQVPLCIGIGWGIILYSAVALADALRLNFAAWAALVGLLGLNIDVTMDAAAIRVGMWNWRALTPTGQYTTDPHALFAPATAWFGVPFGNFYAWFIVLTSAAALFRWLRPAESRSIVALIGKCALTLLGSVIVLVLLDQLYVSFFNGAWWPVAGEIGGALAVIAFGARANGAVVRDPTAARGLAPFAVPVFFHVYFLAVLAALWITPALATRADIRAALGTQLPWLAAVAGTMTVLGVGAHALQAARRAAQPVPAPVAAAGEVGTEHG